MQQQRTPVPDSMVGTLSAENLKILDEYVRACRLAGLKQITISNQIQLGIKSLILYTGGVPLDTVTAGQLEDWYLAISAELRPGSARQYVVSARKLMVTIHGPEQAAKMFSRIKPRKPAAVTVREEELLSHDEIQRMLLSCNSERDRAIVAVLFSSGCRVGELVNLNVGDVQFSRIGAALHLSGKTGERDVDIFSGVPELKNYLNVHPQKSNPQAPLFVRRAGTGYARITAGGVRVMLGRLAERAGIPETKRHNPHSFRHRRATDLADHLTTADLREMFGWADMSTTPNIYVHSSRGTVKRKLAEIAGIKIPETVTNPVLVRQCPVCGCINSSTARWCDNCHAVLDEELARWETKIEKFMLDHVQK